MSIYLFIYLFIYLSTYYVFMHNKQTDKKTKQIPKLTFTINWGYNSYFTLSIYTVNYSYTKLGREFTCIYDRL